MLDAISSGGGWSAAVAGNQQSSWMPLASGKGAGGAGGMSAVAASPDSMPMDRQTMGAMVVTSTLDRLNGPVLAGSGSSAAMAEDYNFNKSVLMPWTGKGTFLDISV